MSEENTRLTDAEHASTACHAHRPAGVLRMRARTCDLGRAGVRPPAAPQPSDVHRRSRRTRQSFDDADVEPGRRLVGDSSSGAAGRSRSTIALTKTWKTNPIRVTPRGRYKQKGATLRAGEMAGSYRCLRATLAACIWWVQAPANLLKQNRLAVLNGNIAKPLQSFQEGLTVNVDERVV